jgi:hypothetical protein
LFLFADGGISIDEDKPHPVALTQTMYNGGDLMDQEQLKQMKDAIQAGYEPPIAKLSSDMNEAISQVSHLEETLRSNAMLDLPAIMDQTQNMKDAIRGTCQPQIDELLEELENFISAVSRVEQRLYSRPVLQPSQPSTPTPPPVNPKDGKSLSAAQRIKSALETMHGEFTSFELWDAANKDGHGAPITRSAFATCFARLLKNGQVIQVSAHIGNVPGTYRRP